MASSATRQARHARAFRRVAISLSVVGCILGLGALPTAQAAKSSASTSASSTEAPVVASHPKRAERIAQAEGVAPPPAPAQAPVSAPGEQSSAPHGHHGQPPFPPPPGALAGPGARKLDREAPAAHGRRHQDAAKSGEPADSTVSQPAAIAAEEPAQDAEAFARKQKKGGKGGKGKEKGKEKPKGKKGKEPAPEEEATSEEGSNPGNSKGKEAVAETSSTSHGSSGGEESEVAPPPASAVTGAGAASIVSLAPVAKTISVADVRAQRSGRPSHRRTARRGASARATPLAAGAAVPLASATLASAASKPAAKPHATSTHKHSNSTQPALVKSITRIVGVVPTPVRILIAALIALALALAVRSRLSGVRTRRLMRQRGQLLEDVGLLQAALLPVPPARLGPVGTSVAYRPADGPGAGGDFYDVFALEDGRLAVIVGDVSGHGREALPHTALVRFTVRAYLEAGLSPRKRAADRRLVLDHQLGGSFATVVAAVYHPRERTLTYSSAGHPPPVVLGERAGAHEQGAARDGGADDGLLGAAARRRHAHGHARDGRLWCPARRVLCFHTDGVTEARVGEDLFGPSGCRRRSSISAATRTPRRCWTASPSAPTRVPTTWRRAC